MAQAGSHNASPRTKSSSAVWSYGRTPGRDLLVTAPTSALVLTPVSRRLPAGAAGRCPSSLSDARGTGVWVEPWLRRISDPRRDSVLTCTNTDQEKLLVVRSPGDECAVKQSATVSLCMAPDGGHRKAATREDRSSRLPWCAALRSSWRRHRRSSSSRACASMCCP